MYLTPQVHKESFIISYFFKKKAFLTDMVFSNGCRAPPWRQVVGDICYIQVTTKEDKQFYITASTEGYYVNKVSMGISRMMDLTFLPMARPTCVHWRY